MTRRLGGGAGEATRSWRGDPRLKAHVLAATAAHHRAARLDLLVLDGQTLALYGWRAPVDFPRLGHALGLPAALLSIGSCLWEGLPEDSIGTREHIDGVRRFLGAIPVGRALGRVVPEWLARWASDPQWRVASVEEGPVAALFDELALGLLGEPFEEQRLEAARRDVVAKIERERRRDLWPVVEALDVAVAIVRWEQEPAALYGAIRRGLRPEVEDAARLELLALLARAP